MSNVTANYRTLIEEESTLAQTSSNEELVGWMVSGLNTAIDNVYGVDADTILDIRYDVGEAGATKALNQLPTNIRTAVEHADSTFCGRHLRVPFWKVTGKVYVFEDLEQEAAMYNMATKYAAGRRCYQKYVETGSSLYLLQYQAKNNQAATIGNVLGTSKTYT